MISTRREAFGVNDIFNISLIWRVGARRRARCERGLMQVATKTHARPNILVQICDLFVVGTDVAICDGGALYCQNEGRCVNGTICICYPGYTGRDCSRGQLHTT